MRLFVFFVALSAGIAVAAEPEPAVEADDVAPLEQFNHEEHEGLKVDCQTCHVKRGKAELRDNACAECHD